MKRKQVFWAVSLLTVAAILVSGKIILAQPQVKKICFYPKLNGSDDIKLEDLKPSQAVCFDDEATLGAFNSVKTSIVKLNLWHGGIIGTFTDEKNKIHLIRVSFTDAYIADDTKNKVYTIKDENKIKEWYDAVNKSLAKVDSLE